MTPIKGELASELAGRPWLTALEQIRVFVDEKRGNNN